MIDEIQVKDVALIREASLSPSPRLTVLTGETGAGKTALVSAVKLLVGERNTLEASLSLIQISEPTRRRGISGGVVGV